MRCIPLHSSHLVLGPTFHNRARPSLRSSTLSTYRLAVAAVLHTAHRCPTVSQPHLTSPHLSLSLSCKPSPAQPSPADPTLANPPAVARPPPARRTPPYLHLAA